MGDCGAEAMPRIGEPTHGSPWSSLLGPLLESLWLYKESRW